MNSVNSSKQISDVNRCSMKHHYFYYGDYIIRGVKSVCFHITLLPWRKPVGLVFNKTVVIKPVFGQVNHVETPVSNLCCSLQ